MHYDIISDKSTYFLSEAYSDSRMIPKKFNFSFTFNSNPIIIALSKVGTISLESRLSIIWDIIYGLFLLSYLFMVPVLLSFSEDFGLIEDIVFIIFLANTLLAFNKNYYYHGKTISDRKSILRNFFQTQFMIDFIVFLAVRGFSLKIFAFLKFPDIYKVLKSTDDHF